jgi:hypothetical protein
MPASDTLHRADMLPSNDIGNPTAEAQFLDGRGKMLFLRLPSNGSLANKAFRVRLAGRVATSSNITFTARVYFGLSSVIASNTGIFLTGAQSVNNTSASWELWLDMAWSNDSKTLTGRGAGQIANQILGPATLDNIPIAADPFRDNNTFLQSGPTYGFTVTGLFSGSDANSHAYVDFFQLELV